MDPEQEDGVVGGVGQPGHLVDAVDRLVDGADPSAHPLGVLGGAEDRRHHVVGGAVEATPDVIAVVAVLLHGGDRQRVESLQHQRPQPADQQARLLVQEPGRRTRPEEPEVDGGRAHVRRHAPWCPVPGASPGVMSHSGSMLAIPASSSGDTGIRDRVRPVAARIAATMAAGEEISGGSPTPLAP